MDLKVKSSIIIIITFMLGLFVGGIVTRSFFAPPKMGDVIRDLRRQEGFTRRFERIIEPTESQKEKIREILQNHFERVHGQSEEFRKRFFELNDSLKIELDPILSEDQKARLEEMEKRFREHGRPGFGPGARPREDFPRKRKHSND